jgi:predicted transcriptional regulator
MKYRSRTDIVSQILEAANGGATKTKIMYVQGVPFVRAAKGIPVGAGGEWAAGLPGRRAENKTTDKGLRFMRTYDEIGEMVSPEA